MHALQGCDGSVLIDSTANNTAEKDAVPNNPSLRGFEVIDAAKTAIEARCPKTVSCADILAFAARDSVALASGNSSNLTYKVPAGRRDGRVSRDTDANSNLPSPLSSAAELVGNFTRKNLTAEDMVVLSGAHTVGRSHCSSFVPDRLAVPSDINAGFANFLRRRCPANPAPAAANDPTVNQDIVTPNALDNQYYKNVLAHKVLFTSDAALLTAPATAKMVGDNANIPGWWEGKFKKSFVKMSQIEVKTRNQGEIRKYCRAVNTK